MWEKIAYNQDDKEQEKFESDAGPQWTMDEIEDRRFVDCMIAAEEDEREQQLALQEQRDAVTPVTAADLAEADREEARGRARQLQTEDEAREILEAVAQWEEANGPMWGVDIVPRKSMRTPRA